MVEKKTTTRKRPAKLSYFTTEQIQQIKDIVQAEVKKELNKLKITKTNS